MVVRGHEARAEAQLDVADPLACGVLDILVGHAAAGVVVRQHGDHPLELCQKLDQPGVGFSHDHMWPQFLPRPSRERDVVAPPEIKNRLQTDRAVEVAMQIDEGQPSVHDWVFKSFHQPKAISGGATGKPLNTKKRVPDDSGTRFCELYF